MDRRCVILLCLFFLVCLEIYLYEKTYLDSTSIYSDSSNSSVVTHGVGNELITNNKAFQRVDGLNGYPTNLSKEMYHNGLYRPPNNIKHVPETNKSYMDRIHYYNNIINDLRLCLLKNTSRITLFRIPSNVTVIAGNKEDYLERLSEIPSVHGLVLDWPTGAWNSSSNVPPVLIKEYFPRIASTNTCHHLQNIYKKRRPDEQCTSNISEAQFLRPLEKKELSDSMYIHLIENGVVTPLGEVYAGEYKIAPKGCHMNLKTLKSIHITSYFDEVFSISQYWGGGHFHKNIENFPKLAPYLHFLHMNPSIKIHVFESGVYTKSFMTILGLHSSRLVTGNVRGRIIYLPRVVFCGNANLQETQLLSYFMRSTGYPKSQEVKTRKSLVLIKRTKHRFIKQAQETESMLQTIADEYGLRFYIFRDNPPPALKTTIEEFQKAVMVVGPHGAGLSNLLFVEPGTYVVEALCKKDTNMCFSRLAQVLGLRYHGLLSRGGCPRHIDISVSELNTTVRSYLQQMKQQTKRPE